MNILSVDEQYKLISKGAEEIVPENELRNKKKDEMLKK